MLPKRHSLQLSQCSCLNCLTTVLFAFEIRLRAPMTMSSRQAIDLMQNEDDVPHAFAFGDRGHSRALGFGASLETLRLQFVALACELECVLTAVCARGDTGQKRGRRTREKLKT